MTFAREGDQMTLEAREKPIVWSAITGSIMHQARSSAPEVEEFAEILLQQYRREHERAAARAERIRVRETLDRKMKALSSWAKQTGRL